MKKIVVFVSVLIFLIIPKSVFADEGWTIDNFDSQIAIQKSGEVLIKEKIDVDFNYLSKHGIYRDIPYIYENNGVKTYTEIDQVQVLQNGSKAKFSSTLTDGYVRLKIGDPNRTISGKNSYEIDYTARGVLRGFSDHDELYWNVTGNNWPVGISSASASVTLPFDSITKTTCFEGYSGSTSDCLSDVQSATTAKFVSTTSFSEMQGLTAVVGYKKGLVPILKVERPKTFWEKFTSWPSLTTLGVVLVFGISTIVYIWLKNGRDYWYESVLFGTKGYAGKAKPIGAHETTVVEFTPPENLRPAEIGVLVDEKADTLDVTSTIIDLATQGFLKIEEVPKKWMFGKTDYLLKQTNKTTDSLLSYESLLLDKLFADGSSVTISSLKFTFYEDLKQVKTALYDEVVAKGLFPSNPEKVRQKYLGIATFILFGGVFLTVFALSNDIIILADLCFGILVSGVVLLIFSRFMPRKTAYGREMFRRIKGYRLFINTSEKYRQNFFEKKNLFNEVLPYAIMFGLTGKFAKAMKDMGIKNTNPGWYSGSQPFNVIYFGNSMSSFSNSMSSAIASTPSSSGGFSGGSSGGGFGGGGGGSW